MFGNSRERHARCSFLDSTELHDMTNPPTFLDLAGHPFVAGVVGALVGLKFVPGLTWLERVTNLGAGGVLAYYTAPAIVSWWDLSPQMLGFLGFALGMLGRELAQAEYRYIKANGGSRYSTPQRPEIASLHPRWWSRDSVLDWVLPVVVTVGIAVLLKD